ncbi:uncharacterized protein ARMOST_05627 [Armillaria ostoyae]|uniref:Uncharacterized protein n=1 Tax=Armillaria ostoyae TaxID=47428 RepID=A0A284R0P8_ARMOS|nr:uncharacterized protein ARMOST_05627 [Armillaria ostoyae]
MSIWLKSYVAGCCECIRSTQLGESSTDARHILQRFSDYFHLKINQKRLDEMAVTPSNNLDLLKEGLSPDGSINTFCDALTGFLTDLGHTVLDDRRQLTKDEETEINALSMLFTTPYIGRADHGLVQYLTDLNLKFRTYQHPRYSGKYCSIVQGSGVGKSRLLAEVRVPIIDSNQSHRSLMTIDQLAFSSSISQLGTDKHEIFLIYINLRDVADFAKFPPRDSFPANVLCGVPTEAVTPRDYFKQCAAFFAALFTVVKRTIVKDNHGRGGLRQATLRWNEKYSRSLSSNNKERCIFFQDVEALYQKIYTYIVTGRGDVANLTDSNDDGLLSEFEDHSPSSDAKRTSKKDEDKVDVDEEKPMLAQKVVREAYTKLLEVLEELVNSNARDTDKPIMVIAIDEAQAIDKAQSVRSYGPESWSRTHLLCRAIRSYSQCRQFVPNLPAVWTIFTSSNPYVIVNHCAPPARIYSSQRFIEAEEVFFPPFTLGCE